MTVTHRLDNGLRLTVAADDTAIAGIAVHYGVGFRSEQRDQSGLAHLFEHLMFQGGTHFRDVERAGGSCNASTRQDYTEFHTVVPAGNLARILRLEADRMRGRVITQQTIRTETAVVREEVLGKTHRPYGGLPWPRLSAVLFRTFANAHDGYGDHEALRHVTVEDCRAFFDRHYSPANAVVTVVGGVDARRVTDLVERYFGAIPACAVAPATAQPEPGPETDRRLSYADPMAALPALAAGYRIPDPVTDPRSHVALNMLADVLAGGARPRLGESMTAAGCETGPLSARCGLFDLLDARDPDMWVMTAVHGRRTCADAVLSVLDAELRSIAADGPVPADLDRVRARAVNVHHRRMDQIVNRLRLLGRCAILFDDVDLAATLPTLHRYVGADDLAAAAAFLGSSCRAVLEARPTPR